MVLLYLWLAYPSDKTLITNLSNIYIYYLMSIKQRPIA